MSYHATVREGMRKYEQIIDSESVRTRECLGSSKVSEIDVNECCGAKNPPELPGSVVTKLIVSVLQQFWLCPYSGPPRPPLRHCKRTVT